MKIHANEHKQASLQQRDALSAVFRSLAGTRERVQARSSLWTFGRDSFPKDLRDSFVRLSVIASEGEGKIVCLPLVGTSRLPATPQQQLAASVRPRLSLSLSLSPFPWSSPETIR